MSKLLVLLCLMLIATPLEAKRSRKSHSRKASGSAGSRKSSNRRTVQTARQRQQAPSPDRYKEIQGALVTKGYLKSEPNGVWDQDSVAALKSFQADQNLEPTGKLNSLSLIALGLGPKAETPGAPAAPTEPPTPAEPRHL